MKLLRVKIDAYIAPLAILLLLYVSCLAIAHVDEGFSSQVNCPLCKILNLLAAFLTIHLVVFLFLQIVADAFLFARFFPKNGELHFHLVNRGPPASFLL